MANPPLEVKITRPAPIGCGCVSLSTRLRLSVVPPYPGRVADRLAEVLGALRVPATRDAAIDELEDLRLALDACSFSDAHGAMREREAAATGSAS